MVYAAFEATENPRSAATEKRTTIDRPHFEKPLIASAMEGVYFAK